LRGTCLNARTIIKSRQSIKTLAEGVGAQEFAACLVSFLGRKNVSSCVYEDRDGLDSVLLAGRKPEKTLKANQTYTLQICGSDQGSIFKSRLRVIISGELSEELAADLEEAVRECARQVEKNMNHCSLTDRTNHTSNSNGFQLMTAPNYVVRWGILAASAVMFRLLEEIEMYGPERPPVLITGETGTGKERVAQALHEASGRRGRLVAVNCGCIAPDLIESLLFGYVRGAFTGAIADKKGYFEEADGGTIFLDEIGDMPMKAQVALLRILQERKVRRLGDINERRVDVRLLAATHCDLERMVSEGTFRRDLYYRLRGLAIHIPALRERRDEIQPLTDYFLRGISEERGRSLEITREARLALLANLWEGNVRELVQCLEAAAVRARDGIIDVNALILRSDPAAGSMWDTLQGSTKGDGPLHSAIVTLQAQSNGHRHEKSYSEMMDEYEKSLLQETLDACGGNVPRAASLLKMSAITLRRRIRILGVERRATFVALPFIRERSFQVRASLGKVG
jgi:transcriptional regulator with PAS, ATPase and Fis domain